MIWNGTTNVYWQAVWNEHDLSMQRVKLSFPFEAKRLELKPMPCSNFWTRPCYREDDSAQESICHARSTRGPEEASGRAEASGQAEAPSPLRADAADETDARGEAKASHFLLVPFRTLACSFIVSSMTTSITFDVTISCSKIGVERSVDLLIFHHNLHSPLPRRLAKSWPRLCSRFCEGGRDSHLTPLQKRLTDPSQFHLQEQNSIIY